MQVVLIHGITAPEFVYKNVVDALVKEGFQVLLYGQYLSENCARANLITLIRPLR